MSVNNVAIRFLLITASICGFLSCDKDEKLTQEYHAREGVFILNEGNFTYGNASLSFYTPEADSVTNNVFSKTNGFPIGDVLQSMTIIDSLAYLVVNNSGKILVINANTFKYKATIGGFLSPRELLSINPTKAYVSDLYSSSITIINPQNFTVTGHLSIKKSSETMIKFGDYVLVANWSKQNTVFRINSLTDQLVDSVVVTRQPNSMVLDKNNKLWVLSDGGYAGMPGKQNACLTRIDASNFSIEKEFVFADIASSPNRLCINSSRDTLYFLNGSWGSNVSNGGVYRMATDASDLPRQPFIAEKKRLFYGLGIDPVKKDIYVSDAVDYLQAGWVFRYSNMGQAIDSFKTDIIPSSFCFKYEK